MAEPEHHRSNPLTRREHEQTAGLKTALDAAAIRTGELWLRYFSIGGSAGEYEVEAHLESLMPMSALERDLLAHAANELIDELPPRPHAPYADQLKITSP
jgi:hypothetical protein